jgi:hypothetical protein
MSANTSTVMRGAYSSPSSLAVVAMQIPKPSEADLSRFRSLVPDDPRVVVKPMFGNVGAFVNGNMFMGLFGSDIGVKLPAAEQERLRGLGGGAFGPAERPMGGYTTIPPGLPAARTRRTVAAALDFVAALAPKQAKPRR